MTGIRDAKDVQKFVKDKNVSFIQFWFTDVLGRLKTFSVTPSELAAGMSEGMGFDGSSIEGFARIEESDRILGFELGADDYITKPFSPKELVLRVQAVLRRYSEKDGKSGDGLFHVQGHTMRFDERNHSLTVNDEEVFLTAAEWRILAHLIDKADELVSRSEILTDCFDYNAESYERVVDTHIKNIRAKLGDGPWIETIRGWGYRFIGHKAP